MQFFPLIERKTKFSLLHLVSLFLTEIGIVPTNAMQCSVISIKKLSKQSSIRELPKMESAVVLIKHAYNNSEGLVM